MRNILLLFAVVLTTLVTSFSAEAQSRKVPKYLADSVAAALRRVTLVEVAGSYVKVESIKVVGDGAEAEDGAKPVLEIRASVELAFYPMRPQSIESLYSEVRKVLPKDFKEYDLKLYADGRAIEKLVPQYYADESEGGSFTYKTQKPLVTRVSRVSQPQRGLANRHIALWQSHGRYFNNNTGEWSWQRARLWETVEDLYTQSYVVPFLVPMLERAGASVLLPRERSMRREEIIIDNDKSIDPTTYAEEGEWCRAGVGFAHQGEHRGHLLGVVQVLHHRVEGPHDPAGMLPQLWAPLHFQGLLHVLELAEVLLGRREVHKEPAAGSRQALSRGRPRAPP